MQNTETAEKDAGCKSVLKEYYSRFLTEIRGVKKSSVNHYFTGLNTVSGYLRKKGLVVNDVYEIMSLDELETARSVYIIRQ